MHTCNLEKIDWDLVRPTPLPTTLSPPIRSLLIFQQQHYLLINLSPLPRPHSSNNDNKKNLTNTIPTTRTPTCKAPSLPIAQKPHLIHLIPMTCLHRVPN